MNPPRDFQPSAFFKQQILPVLFVFLIPVLSLATFYYADKRFDEEVLQAIRKNINGDTSRSSEEKAADLQFFESMPVSKIMSSDDPEFAPLQEHFASLKTSYATFRWMERIAWFCLATILLTFLVVGVSVWISLRSQPALYHSLRIGWFFLKVSATIQVLGQAILACALSYWLTAILFDMYSVKIVVVIAVLALFAVFALMKAILAQVTDHFEVTGELLPAGDGAQLRDRIRNMAENLQTSPPDHIILGTDANFFVTEHPIVLDGKVLEGRSLYVSLPLLKTLSVEEADAVLAHELAHFSGQDTFWSRKISPLRSKFSLYINILHNGLSTVVAKFMICFWNLYGLSISKLSRTREFRADGVAAEITSKDAFKRALAKVTGYCEYRGKTEESILRREKVDPELKLSQLLETGYPTYLASFVQNSEALTECVPHPFDSHPPMSNRLSQLGFSRQDIAQDARILSPVGDSWYRALASAPELERKLWEAQDRALRDFHGQDLAWRLLPKNDEEAAIVEQLFPRMEFQKDGKELVGILTFDRLTFSDWEAPILFKDIVELQLESVGWPKNRLTITHKKSGQARNITTKCYPSQYTNERGNMLEAFQYYYTRHKTAVSRTAAGTV